MDILSVIGQPGGIAGIVLMVLAIGMFVVGFKMKSDRKHKKAAKQNARRR